MGRDCFGFVGVFFWLVVIIEVIGTGALQAHMRPPCFIPSFEFRAELGQVINSLDLGNLLYSFREVFTFCFILKLLWKIKGKMKKELKSLPKVA